MIEMVDSIPRSSYVADDVAEFVESGQPVARVTYEGREPRSVLQAMRLYLRKNEELRRVVRCVWSAGSVYLCRVEAV